MSKPPSTDYDIREEQEEGATSPYDSNLSSANDSVPSIAVEAASTPSLPESISEGLKNINLSGTSREQDDSEQSIAIEAAFKSPLKIIPEVPGNIDLSGSLGEQDKATHSRWDINEPYRTPLAKDEDPWQSCFKQMWRIDDEMCRGWREEIDTLLIFAGLFSATVTAFVVESFQWLEESPTDMLSRLQLRSLLISMDDPTVDSVAPASFTVGATIIWTNTLWFASLTLALALVVVSILCKQWLYEYQRYENLNGEQSFRIRELRYQGLLGWRVPTIISFLPLLLQAALVLFFAGLIVLLWSLQDLVASIVTILVAGTLTFLTATSVLPGIQYIFPIFHTQCPYKSSQSLFLSLIPFSYLPGLDGGITSWVGGDLWEITHLDPGSVSGLLRFYDLFSTSVDAVRNIYHCLDAARGNVAFEFIQKLSQRSDLFAGKHPVDLGDEQSVSTTPSLTKAMGQQKGFVMLLRSLFWRRGDWAGKADVENSVPSINIQSPSNSAFSESNESIPAHFIKTNKKTRLQRLRKRLWKQFPKSLKTLLRSWNVYDSKSDRNYRNWEDEHAIKTFLASHLHFSDTEFLNRHAEHCVRLLDNSRVPPATSQILREFNDTAAELPETLLSDNVVASQLVGSLSEAFADNRISEDSFQIVWDTLLPGLMRLHSQRGPLDCSPYILLRDVEKWLAGSPHLGTKLRRIQKVTDRLRNIMRDSKNNIAAADKQHVDLLVGSLASFFARTDMDAVGWFSIGDGPEDNVAPSLRKGSGENGI